MISLYQRIYYELYLLWRRKKDEVGNAKYNAVLSISLLFWLNLYSVVTVLDVSLGLGVLKIIVSTNRIVLGIVFVCVLILNWLVLGRKSSHKQIEMTRQPVDNGQSNYSRLGVILYVVASVVMNPLLAYVLPPYAQ